jgi:hypothetical protein
MPTQHQPVTLASIDLDSVAESLTNYEAVEFDILLSEPVDDKWIEEFDIAYRNTPFEIKPPAHAKTDRITVEYLPRYDSELQNYIEWLKAVLARVDEEIRKTLDILEHDARPHNTAQFREALKKVSV